MPSEDKQPSLNREPLEQHVRNLLDDLEGDIPEGGKVELLGFVSVVEVSIANAKGETQEGFVARFRGSPATTLGLLSIAEDRVKSMAEEIQGSLAEGLDS